MVSKRNLIERIDRLEEMIIEKNWKNRNLEKRIEALESNAIRSDIKEFNTKRKPGRPRKNEASDAKKK